MRRIAKSTNADITRVEVPSVESIIEQKKVRVVEKITRQIEKIKEK
jgi:uncharacterized hydantoinase/oxoprolinase family protein